MRGWFIENAGLIFLFGTVGSLFAIFLWHGLRERRKPWFREYIVRRSRMTVSEKIQEFAFGIGDAALGEAILWLIVMGGAALLSWLLGPWG